MEHVIEIWQCNEKTGYPRDSEFYSKWNATIKVYRDDNASYLVAVHNARHGSPAIALMFAAAHWASYEDEK